MERFSVEVTKVFGSGRLQFRIRFDDKTVSVGSVLDVRADIPLANLLDVIFDRAKRELLEFIVEGGFDGLKEQTKSNEVSNGT